MTNGGGEGLKVMAVGWGPKARMGPMGLMGRKGQIGAERGGA